MIVPLDAGDVTRLQEEVPEVVEEPELAVRQLQQLLLIPIERRLNESAHDRQKEDSQIIQGHVAFDLSAQVHPHLLH